MLNKIIKYTLKQIKIYQNNKRYLNSEANLYEKTYSNIPKL